MEIRSKEGWNKFNDDALQLATEIADLFIAKDTDDLTALNALIWALASMAVTKGINVRQITMILEITYLQALNILNK